MSADQATLFDTPTTTTCPHGRTQPECPFCNTRRTDPPTSLNAARTAIGNSKLRATIYQHHLEHPNGLTDNQLQALIPTAHPGSVAKRRHDLTTAGLLTNTGTTRPTTYGVDATVWTTT